MEMKLNAKNELLKGISDLLGDAKWARTLVEDGKEVPCHRKLQGISTKLLNLVELVRLMPEDIQVIYEVPTNVAETTTQE